MKQINSVDDFKYLIISGVEKIPIDGNEFYARIPSQLDVDIYKSIVAVEGVSPEDQRIYFLCALLCYSEGIRIFDQENEEHRKIVISLGDKIQSYLIVKCQNIFFPKKKSTGRNWNLFLFWQKSWAKVFGRS